MQGNVSSGRRLLETLEDMIRNMPDGEVAVGDLLARMGHQGLLVLCIFLTLPFLVPISLPGVSTVFGFAILLLGLSVLADYPLRLPGRLRKKTVSSDALRQALRRGLLWVRRLEKISHARLTALCDGPLMRRINGLVLVYAAILLMAPFGLVPFSNTMPGLAILLLAVGMLQRDGGCIVLGYGATLLTTLYFATLLFGGALALQFLWTWLRPGA